MNIIARVMFISSFFLTVSFYMVCLFFKVCVLCVCVHLPSVSEWLGVRV